MPAMNLCQVELYYGKKSFYDLFPAHVGFKYNLTASGNKILKLQELVAFMISGT